MNNLNKIRFKVSLFVLIILFLAACGGNATPEVTEVPEVTEELEVPEEPEEPEVAEKIFNVDDIIDMGDVSLIVNEVTWPEGGTYIPPEGYKLLSIIFAIENKDISETMDFFSLRMRIIDAAGESYPYNGFGIDDDSDDIFSDSREIAPGETVRGQIYFDAPEDNPGGLIFVIDASAFGAGEAFIALP